MEFNIKHLIKRIIIILVGSILLEIIVFNHNFLLNKLFYNMENINIEYSGEQLGTINWERREDGTLVSQLDPMIIINNINMDVKNITIKINTNKDIQYVDLFYKGKDNKNKDNGEIYKRYEGSVYKMKTLKINHYIENIRIDLGDEPGIILKSIVVIFNDFSMNFSIARIIAINMIYWGAVLLFMAQTPPKYKI